MDTPRLVIDFVPAIPEGQGATVTEFGHGRLSLRDSLSPAFARLLTEKVPMQVSLSIRRSSSGATNFHIEIDTDWEHTGFDGAGGVSYEEKDEHGVMQSENRTATRITLREGLEQILGES